MHLGLNLTIRAQACNFCLKGQALYALLNKSKERGTGKAAEMQSCAFVARNEIRSFTQALELRQVGGTLIGNQSVGVVAGEGNGGQALLGGQASELGASESKLSVDDLSLKDGVLLLHLSHELVDSVVSAFLGHCW